MTSTDSLRQDPVMAGLIEKHKLQEYYGGQKDHFVDLIEIVIGQQLSMKVADVILKRLLLLFTDQPTPQLLVATSDETLRSVGLSKSKVVYIKNIATAIISGSLSLDKLKDLPDDDVKKELIKIKGLGPWSAEMFLIFSLKRPDVFSVGDLGLRTAIEKLYGIKRDNLKKIAELAQSWRPHRSLASRLLWASLDNAL